ncbi:MAG TPA: tRNA lysidine(34) synthetase TilS [Candidatus Saccharimonadales bacterium]|jgi:tRNA(Ile)-lysidine synthase|nr:tRNA lysidine(34) synthetase TilS [Candidatus Saccharimonadales bacterium]
MNQDPHLRVCNTIARHAMIRPGDRVGLGVSGGADSMAMLRIFAELQTKLGITIFVLHFHHQLRGEDADEDERFVKSVAEQFDFPFVSGRANVAEEAKLQSRNVEDAARRLRYKFFNSAAETHGLDRIAVAHTADDQAETVLSHLLRGTGLTGLAGIYPVAGFIIRPLLESSRQELRAFLSDLRQPWREDLTNQDTSHMRARIRHQLLPLLLSDFDSAAVTRLARLAGHAREDEAFWRSLENAKFQDLATRETPTAISLGIDNLLFPMKGSSFPSLQESQTPHSAMALSRRLVRKIYSELRGTREQLTSRHVESVIELATKSQSGARINLPGISVERIFNRLLFKNGSTAADKIQQGESLEQNCTFTYTVERPERVDSASVVVTEIHRRFSLKIVDWPPSPRDTVSGRIALDFERVQWPLVLRNWLPGDSYRPQGSRSARKVKRLLLESRIPRSSRIGWPILTSQGRVIWASGYPVAAEFAANEGTKNGLIIAEETLAEEDH